MRRRYSVKFLPKNRGCVMCELHIYSHDFFESIFACHVSGHAIIISIKQYSGMDIFPAIIISHMGLGISMLIMKSFLSICKRLTNDEMQCVIAGENPGNVFSCWIYQRYKTGQFLFFGSKAKQWIQANSYKVIKRAQNGEIVWITPWQLKGYRTSKTSK